MSRRKKTSKERDPDFQTATVDGLIPDFTKDVPPESNPYAHQRFVSVSPRYVTARTYDHRKHRYLQPPDAEHMTNQKRPMTLQQLVTRFTKGQSVATLEPVFEFAHDHEFTGQVFEHVDHLSEVVRMDKADRAALAKELSDQISETIAEYNERLNERNEAIEGSQSLEQTPVDKLPPAESTPSDDTQA